MNAQNSFSLSATCVLLIVNSFFVTDGSATQGGVLDGVLGDNGLVGGLLGNDGLVGGLLGDQGLVGGLLNGGGGNSGGGLLGGLLNSGSGAASNCTGAVTQPLTCPMQSTDDVVDGVVKKCNSSSTDCDDCMKKMCDKTCEQTCDPGLLRVSVNIVVCVRVLLKLGVLKLVSGLVNIDAAIKAAIKLVLHIGL